MFYILSPLISPLPILLPIKYSVTNLVDSVINSMPREKDDGRRGLELEDIWIPIHVWKVISINLKYLDDFYIPLFRNNLHFIVK